MLDELQRKTRNDPQHIAEACIHVQRLLDQKGINRKLLEITRDLNEAIPDSSEHIRGR
jgi:hypothetical protein